MKKKLISIIVPVYKVEEYLDRSIESILKQTYTNFELILVDDGSPDNCPKMCDEWAKKDKRIRVIHKENAGVSEARNTGLDSAKGDFVCFVDSDDFVTSDYLELLLNKQNETDADLVFGKYFVYYNDQNYEKKDEELLSKLVYNKDLSVFFLIQNSVMGSIWRTLYKKELLKNFRFDSTIQYCEDMHFLIRVINNAKTMEMIDAPIYYYFVNEQSVTQNIKAGYTDKYSYGVLKCLELLDESYTDHDNAAKYKIYLIACQEYLITKNKKSFKEYSNTYNSRENYRFYMKNISGLLYKLRARLCHYKMLGLYKILLKLKRKKWKHSQINW